MIDYKPKGKELKIAKTIQKMLRRFKGEHGYGASPTCASIGIDFNIEGVRTNGTEDITSLLDVREYLQTFSDECRDGSLELLKQVDDVSLMLNELENSFTVCTKCKGKKGGFDKDKQGYQRGGWSDCTKCKGRGILL